MWLNKIKPVRYCLIYCSHKVTAWLLLRSGILSDDKFPPQILSTFLSIRTDMSFVVVSSQTFIEFPNFSVSLLLFYSQLLFKYKHFLFIVILSRNSQQNYHNLLRSTKGYILLSFCFVC